MIFQPLPQASSSRRKVRTNTNTAHTPPAGQPPATAWLHAMLSLSLFALFWCWGQQLPLQVAPATPAAALQWPGSTPQPDHHNDWGIYFPHSQRQSLLQLPGQLTLFRAEFGHRQTEGELIGWANRLYNQKRWTQTASRALSLGLINARLTELKSLSGETRLLIHWYQVGNFSGHNDLAIKLAQLRALLSASPALGQINAVSVLVTDPAQDESRLLQLAAQLAATSALPPAAALDRVEQAQ